MGQELIFISIAVMAIFLFIILVEWLNIRKEFTTHFKFAQPFILFECVIVVISILNVPTNFIGISIAGSIAILRTILYVGMGIYYAEQAKLPSLPILMQRWGIPTLQKKVVNQNLVEEHLLSKEETLQEEQALPQEETLPEGKTLPEEQALPQEETLPEGETLPEENLLTEGETLPEEDLLTEGETLQKEQILSEDQVLPAENLDSVTEMMTESENPNLTISLQTVLTSGLLVGVIGILYSSGLFWLTAPTSAIGEITFTPIDLAFGLLIVIEAAVLEETVYRLCLQNFIISKLESASFAILFTSVVWTLLHSGVLDPNWVKMAQIFPMGLLLGVLNKKYGTESAIVAHLTFNIVLVFLSPYLISS